MNPLLGFGVFFSTLARDSIITVRTKVEILGGIGFEQKETIMTGEWGWDLGRISRIPRSE